MVHFTLALFETDTLDITPINLLFGISFRRQNLSPPSPYTKIGISAEVENCKKLPKNSVRMYDFSSFPVIRLIKKLHLFFN